MSTLGTGVLTLLDMAKELGPNHEITQVINILAQEDEFLPFLPMMECNDGTTHIGSVVTQLPTAQFRAMNEAVNPSKGDSTQERFATGLMTQFSRCDEQLAKLSGNPGQFRVNAAKKHLEAMKQLGLATLFYGNGTTTPKSFNGLSVHYNSLSTATQTSAANVINAAGTQDSPSDLCSIWAVSLGSDTIHGLYPKGTQGGMSRADRGVVLVPGATGATGSILPMFVDEFNWWLGLAILDWRAAGRVANIDISDRLAATDSVIPGLVRRLLASVEPGTGKLVLVMNRSAKYIFNEEIRREVGGGGGLTYENVDGRNVTTYQGVPVLRCDALTSTETAVA